MAGLFVIGYLSACGGVMGESSTGGYGRKSDLGGRWPTYDTYGEQGANDEEDDVDSAFP